MAKRAFGTVLARSRSVLCVVALAFAGGDASAQSPSPSPSPSPTRPSPTSDLDDAVALQRLVSAPATSGRDRELAQYRLAVALYRAKLHHAAFGIFSEIADHPNHLEFQATLPWLARLATDLPEPADVDERVGKYDELAIDQLDPRELDLRFQLDWLLGRYKYRNRQYEDALRLFAKVGRQSKYYCKAQFFSGIANVHLRRPVEAVKSFQRIVQAIDDGYDAMEDKQRMRDLAVLSIARTYYSAAVRIDARGAPAIHRVRLAAAVKNWNAVDTAGEYWQGAIFEQSWAYFLVGDHARALGNIHTIQSVFFQNAYNPEVDVLKSVVYIANCQFDDAAALTARFHSKYQPMSTELTKVLGGFDGADQDERVYQFARDVRDGKGSVSPLIRLAVAQALSDRQFLRHLQYVLVLEEEQKRFGKAPRAFQESALGNDVKDALQLARDIAVRNTAEVVRERTKRQLDALDEHLRDNTRLLMGAMAGRRGELDEALVTLRVPGSQAERNVVRPDEEHVIWPFTGEYWSDEVGSYRQSIRSSCR